ncbi:GntR family transcriptional regulator (plasmid) [Thioclava sp. 'Guangxiensis']|uniref:GntR family transcriptional regulator n=1 Tax=Thioclava sp. 'Guangxiensis' TaxID=3149044 RepID=UPI0032C4811F
MVNKEQMTMPDRQEKPSERAYNAIRTAILSGVLAPGEHLREERLTHLTQTSRTPIREALRQLVTDGLAAEHNRHRYVADFSDTEINVLFDIRARMEGYAAAMAARLISTEDLIALDALVSRMDAIDPRGGKPSVDMFDALNTQFHEKIVQSTGSVQLARMVKPAMNAPAMLIKQHLLHQAVGILASNAQHREIVKALRARSPEWAEAAMRAHILSTRPTPVK